MRVCKSCHNNMIIVVNCDRPRPLYRPFSRDVTTAILVFTNNDNFSRLESVNIYYHWESQYGPQDNLFLARNSKFR